MIPQTAPYFALTLRPEWAFAIMDGANWDEALFVPKRTENRTWRPSLERLPVGAQLAIHAGAGPVGRANRETVQLAYWDANPEAMHRRSSVMPVSLRAWLCGESDAPASAIVAVATIDGYDRECRTGWDIPGNWHWRLRDVKALTRPVPAKGRQGLWPLSEEQRAAIVRAL